MKILRQFSDTAENIFDNAMIASGIGITALGGKMTYSAAKDLTKNTPLRPVKGGYLLPGLGITGLGALATAAAIKDKIDHKRNQRRRQKYAERKGKVSS